MEVAGGRLLAKGGAAGLHCTVELRTGRALTVKLESGDGTWIHAAVVAALGQLGWLESDEMEQLAGFGRPVLTNHRKIKVGEARPIFSL